MMKKIHKAIFITVSLFLPICAIAQSDPFDFGDMTFNEDDLFGGSDDDDLFGGNLVEEWSPESSTTDPDLAQGILFKDGSVKIGGSVSASIGTSTTLFDESYTPFGDNVEKTTIDPSLSGTLSIDARPSQTLRMYGKMSLNYPFESTAIGIGTATVNEYFKMKELFTDFSINDAVFFRFGLHTVSWGTGFFYSPASDMINTSSIDPENTSAQVSGSLNLRAQIPFPGTQNCLWLYMIPPSANSTEGSNGTFSSATDADSFSIADTLNGGLSGYGTKLNQTALAAKYEFIAGGWELGVGTLLKYQGAPKVMGTFSGSIIKGKVAVFGEGVYQYGSSNEWSNEPDDWYAKSHIFHFTAGGMYTWKDANTMIAAQYYYNGNKDDAKKYYNGGHNIALMLSISDLFNQSKLSASIFGMLNIGHDKFDKETLQSYIGNKNDGSSYYSVTDEDVDAMNKLIPALTLSAMINYSPFNSLSFSAGPYLTLAGTDYPPTVNFKLTAKLGGGNF